MTPLESRPVTRGQVVLVAILAITLIGVSLFFGTHGEGIVSGSSMFPTLKPEDRLLLTRGYVHPERGDIVVFRYNEDGTPTEYVKRIVGLPGDEIVVSHGEIYVNGKRDVGPAGFYFQDVPALTVPAGSVYVSGDNRLRSLDSRDFGPIPISSIKGRAMAIFAPINRIRSIPPGLESWSLGK